jgi:hypothetical protein
MLTEYARALVVDAESASPQLPGVTYYGIEATHSGMAKFGSASAPGYRTISTAIREWVREAPPVIEIRWAIEEEDRQARARHDIDERRMPFVSLPFPCPICRTDAEPQMPQGQVVSGPSNPAGMDRPLPNVQRRRQY